MYSTIFKAITPWLKSKLCIVYLTNVSITYLLSTLVYRRVYIPFPGPPALKLPPPPIIMLRTQWVTKSLCWWPTDSRPITMWASSGSGLGPMETSDRSASSCKVIHKQLFDVLTLKWQTSSISWLPKCMFLLLWKCPSHYVTLSIWTWFSFCDGDAQSEEAKRRLWCPNRWHSESIVFCSVSISMRKDVSVVLLQQQNVLEQLKIALCRRQYQTPASVVQEYKYTNTKYIKGQIHRRWHNLTSLRKKTA